MVETRSVSFGNGYKTTLEFELVKAGGAQYGNGMSVHMSDVLTPQNDEGIDVRYDTSLRHDGSNFAEWVDTYIMDRFSMCLEKTGV